MSLLRRLRDTGLKSLYCKSPYHFYRLYDAIRAISKVEIEVGGTARTLHPASELELLRWNRIRTKEPETIAWIDTFKTPGLFLDIGANVGVYSVYALIKHPALQVVSLEPEPNNFYRLADNLNRTAPDRAAAYPLAASDSTQLCRLQQSNPEGIGVAHNQIQNRDVAKGVGCMAFTVDDLVEHLGMPSYIKIDVDGIEQQIIQGMEKTLASPGLLSVLVEVYLAEAPVIDELLKAKGFLLTKVSAKNGLNRIYHRRSD